MDIHQLVKFYGGKKVSVAKALGYQRPTITTWGLYPPSDVQLRVQLETNGQLKAEPWCFCANGNRLRTKLNQENKG